MSKHTSNLRKNERARTAVHGCIVPPRKNAAKKAFAAQKPRLATNTYVQSVGDIVTVPFVLTAGI